MTAIANDRDNLLDTALIRVISDNVLTIAAKPAEYAKWQQIQNEYVSTYALGTSSGLTAQRDAYAVAYSTLSTYITSLGSNFTTLPGTPLNIVGTTYRSRFQGYYDAKVTLDNAVKVDAAAKGSAAQLTANTALTNAQNAQNTADAANTAATDAARDDLLSPSEKQKARLEWNILISEKAGNNATSAIYAATAAENTAYNAALQALGTYLNGGTAYTLSTTVPPAWINDASLGTSTAIVGATYRAAWKTWADARQALLNDINVEAGKVALWASVTGAGKPDDNATVGANAGNLQVGIGGRNRLENSLPNSAAGFSHGGDSGLSRNVAYAPPNDGSGFSNAYTFAKKGTYFVSLSGTPPAGRTEDIYKNPGASRIAVNAGQRYEFAVTLSAHRCTAAVLIAWYNSSSVQVGEDIGTIAPANAAVTRSFGFAAAPPTAVTAMVFVRGYLISTESGPYIFTSEWYAGEALAAQTVPSPWSDFSADISVIASKAQADATAAANQAAIANAELLNVTSDDVISKSEKSAEILRYTSLYDEHQALYNKGTEFGLTTEREAYYSTIVTMVGYISGLSQFSTPTVNTAAIGTTYRGTLNAVYLAKQTLMNAIALKASTMATGVTLSTTGQLSGGGTSGQIETTPVLDRERTTVRPPSWYPTGTTREFKQADAFNLLATDGYYFTLETIKQFAQNNGGYPGYQYAYQGAKTWRRQSVDDAGSAWNTWTQDLDRNAYTGSLDATTDLLLTGSGMTILGNTVTKTGGTHGAWDAQVYSPNGYTSGAYAEARVVSTAMVLMFGLNTDPTADASYSSLDYAWYLEGTVSARIYESNIAANSNAVFATIANGDVLAVVTDNVNVFYLQNGIVRRTVAISAAARDQRMHFDSSFLHTGCSLTNVRFGPMTNNSWLALGGDGKAADNATVGPADAATALGLNPQFSAWPVANVYPTGWGPWTGTPIRETANVRTAPLAVKWAVTGVSEGMTAYTPFETTPQAVGVYLRGSFDVNIISNNGGTCRPGYYIVLYTNSALSTSVDVILPAAAGLLGWQRVPFTAMVPAGQRIYGIRIYQMASWPAMTGGASTIGSVCIFDNLRFEFEQPTTPAQTAPSGLAISGIYDIDSQGNANTSTYTTFATMVASASGGTGPYTYSWSMSMTGFLKLAVSGTGSNTAAISCKGSNTQSNGTLVCTAVDSGGRSLPVPLALSIGFGTGTPA